MLLAIDSGNTNISLAVIRGKKILKRWDVNMLQPKGGALAEFTDIISPLSGDYPELRGAIICSVVPDIINPLKRSVRQRAALPVWVIGKDMVVPIDNKYTVPSQVGQDRLVGAFAAKELYGHPVVVVDSGTAITFDVVSASGAYEGGIIVPGMRLSAEALYHKTALLPKIENIVWPRHLIGKDTQESILSGLFNGYSALCSGLIDHLRKEIGKNAKVVVTGGAAPLMKKALKAKIDIIDPDLVFKGMRLVYGRGVL